MFELVVVAAIAATAVTATWSQGAVGAAFECDDGVSYEVRSGDSWFGIANRLEIGAGSLVEANGADLGDLIVPGDRLCLPEGASPSAAGCPTYVVEPGDSWAAIASRAGASAASVATANGTTVARTIHPGDELCLPAGSTNRERAASSATAAASDRSYTVVRGDSWAWIASRAKVSLRSLLAVNDAQGSTLIVPGQVVRLPAGAEVPDSAPEVVLEAATTQGPCWYGDTWHHGRSGGRRHLGADIFPGRGAYVYAVVDGRLTGRTWAGVARNSGNAWMLTGADGTKFFYAHLEDFNPALRLGSSVQAGEILGWVGSTGNSSAPHLHFEIRPGGGEPVNPYPFLRAQGKGCNDGTPYTQPNGWVPD